MLFVRILFIIFFHWGKAYNMLYFTRDALLVCLSDWRFVGLTHSRSLEEFSWIFDLLYLGSTPVQFLCFAKVHVPVQANRSRLGASAGMVHSELGKSSETEEGQRTGT